MKNILAKENVDVLAQYAWSRTIIAFDFDGTLAPIVAERDSARMRAKTRQLLVRLCDIFPCFVVSGRGADDVASRLGGAGLKEVVGNHGLEPGAHLQKFETQMAIIRPILERVLRDTPGVEIEDKRYSLAIHYRKSRSKRAARKTIRDAVMALPLAMRLVLGKLVANVVPERAPTKGDAMLRLRNEHGADTAIYVGDDVTDEDVFSLDQPGRLLTIRVGKSKASAAAYCVRDQRSVDVLLGTLVRLGTERRPR